MFFLLLGILFSSIPLNSNNLPPFFCERYVFIDDGPLPKTLEIIYQLFDDQEMPLPYTKAVHQLIQHGYKTAPLLLVQKAIEEITCTLKLVGKLTQHQELLCHCNDNVEKTKNCLNDYVFDAILTQSCTLPQTATKPLPPADVNFRNITAKNLTVTNNLKADTLQAELVTANLIGDVTGAASRNMLVSGDTMNGPLNLAHQTPIRFHDTTNQNYVALQAAPTVTSTYTLQLPATPGSSAQVLAQSTTPGMLTWQDMPHASTTNASTTNIHNSIVARDEQGNFAASTITADLVGNVLGAASANVNRAGDVMSGSLILANAQHIKFNDATNKYVGIRAPNTLDSSYTLQLPATPGKTGYVVGCSQNPEILTWIPLQQGTTTSPNNTIMETLRITAPCNQLALQTTGTIMFERGVADMVLSCSTIPLYINHRGIIGTRPTSTAFITTINTASVDDLSSKIYGLKPIVFRFKPEYGYSSPQLGITPEDVAKIPELAQYLVARNQQNKPYAINHEQLLILVLNELKKQEQKNKILWDAVMNLQAQITVIPTYPRLSPANIT